MYNTSFFFIIMYSLIIMRPAKLRTTISKTGNKFGLASPGSN